MPSPDTSFPTRAFIGGQWTDASGGGTFPVNDPATGALIAHVADCGDTDAARAIEAAHDAQAGWAGTSAGERAKILRRWRNLMVEEADRLGTLLMRENGKPLAEARGEVLYGASYLDWFSEEARRAYGDIIPAPSGDKRILVIRQPVGVCAAITPWNFPNAMLARKVAAALAAGCTMVAKPAEDTPLSALAMAELGAQAGVPDGVFNIVPTSRASEVGGVFTRHEKVRKITFTGSTGVGRLLLEQAAGTIKKTSMELGGNAPFIVFEDADLDAAADGLIASKFRNAGQTCICANRIFVQAGILEEFSRRVAERVSRLKVARGDEAGADIGPLINADAVRKVERLVDAACASGAQLVTGGQRHAAGELFYTPTILAKVKPDMDIAREEIFGPVIALMSFEHEDDAIAMANDTPFGLAAYAYTRDLARAWRLGERLDYGMVGLNDPAISNAAAPFGGIKQSGMGREGSRYGLDDYLEKKYLLMGGLGSAPA